MQDSTEVYKDKEFHIGKNLCDICIYKTEENKCNVYPGGIPFNMLLDRNAICDKFTLFDLR